MTDTNGDYRPYRVEYSTLVVEQFERLILEAVQRGPRMQVADSTRRILRALHESPEQFGEPLYNLPNTKQQVRLAVVGPLSVMFAVHNATRMVFSREFKLVG